MLLRLAATTTGLLFVLVIVSCIHVSNVGAFSTTVPTTTVTLASGGGRRTKTRLSESIADTLFDTIAGSLPGFGKEEDTATTTSSPPPLPPPPFQPTPEGLIQRAKLVLACDLGIQDESLLDTTKFIWIGPNIGSTVLGKTDYLAAGKFFDLRSTFPDLDYRAHDFRIDANDPMTVRVTVRMVGTMRGELRLRNEVIPPNGKQMKCPPEAISMTFDERTGRLIKLCSGFTMDRLVGNTDGLCGVMGAATIAGSPPSDWEVYPIPRVIARFFGRPTQQLDEPTLFLAPFPETVMVQLAKGIFSADMAVADSDLLSPSFTYYGPYDGPVDKNAYLEKYASQIFNGLDPELSYLRVDPYDPYRVWVDVKPTGTTADGVYVDGPPQSFSFTFDDEGFCIRLTASAVMDPSIGNTGGLTGVEGEKYAAGKASPGVVSRPLPQALQRVRKRLLTPITKIDVDDYSLEPDTEKIVRPSVVPAPPLSPVKKLEIVEKEEILSETKRPTITLPSIPTQISKAKAPEIAKETLAPRPTLTLPNISIPSVSTPVTADSVDAERRAKAVSADKRKAQEAARKAREDALEAKKRRAEEAEEAKKRRMEEAEEAKRIRAADLEKEKIRRAEQAEEEKRLRAAELEKEKMRKAQEAEEARRMRAAELEAERKRRAQVASEQAASEKRTAQEAEAAKIARAAAMEAEKQRKAMEAEQAAKQRAQAAAERAEESRQRSIAAKKAREAAARAQKQAQEAERKKKEMEAEAAKERAQIAEREAEARRKTLAAEQVRAAAAEAQKQRQAQIVAEKEAEKQRKAEAVKQRMAQRAAERKAERERRAEEAKRARELDRQRLARINAEKEAAKLASKESPAPSPRPSISLLGFGSPSEERPAPRTQTVAPQPTSTPAPSPRRTFSLAALFGDSTEEEETSPESRPSKTIPQPKKVSSPPRGVPVISDWKQNRDGSITGRIRGAAAFKEGEKVTTSKVGGKAVGGAVVQTTSGSKYFLEDARATSRRAMEKIVAEKRSSTARGQPARSTISLFGGSSTDRKSPPSSTNVVASQSPRPSISLLGFGGSAPSENPKQVPKPRPSQRIPPTPAQTPRPSISLLGLGGSAPAAAPRASKQVPKPRPSLRIPQTPPAPAQSPRPSISLLGFGGPAAPAPSPRASKQVPKPRASKRVPKASPPSPAQSPRSTFSLFGLGGGKVSNSAASASKSVPIPKSSSKKAPRGVPTLNKWTKNRDGSITGRITGSSQFDKNEKVTTSPIASGDLTSGSVVRTKSGSRYYLA